MWGGNEKSTRVPIPPWVSATIIVVIRIAIIMGVIGIVEVMTAAMMAIVMLLVMPSPLMYAIDQTRSYIGSRPVCSR
jgi:hypothetical protein